MAAAAEWKAPPVLRRDQRERRMGTRLRRELSRHEHEGVQSQAIRHHNSRRTATHVSAPRTQRRDVAQIQTRRVLQDHRQEYPCTGSTECFLSSEAGRPADARRWYQELMARGVIFTVCN